MTWVLGVAWKINDPSRVFMIHEWLYFVQGDTDLDILSLGEAEWGKSWII
jgi:hypothetical protein